MVCGGDVAVIIMPKKASDELQFEVIAWVVSFRWHSGYYVLEK